MSATFGTDVGPDPVRGQRANGTRRESPTRRLKRSLATVPRAAWICALVALANALAWSLIVPPFEVPDENAHYAYVQEVAERGTLPHHVVPEGKLSPAEDAILAIVFYQVVGHTQNPSPFSELQQRTINAVERQRLSTRGSGDALSATNNPPLYYALQAIPYKIVGGTVLDRLAAMRVLAALMGAATVLLVFLFLAELLPGQRWAWTAGALVAALQPLFGFMSGGVNNDGLLYLTATGVLWAIARAFRRGLTPETGAWLGAFVGLGLVSKLTLLGFVPGVLLALALLVRRGIRSDRAKTLRGAAFAVGLGAAPVALYVVLNRAVWHRGTIPGGVGSLPGAAGHIFNFREELSHIWQLFLPHLWMRPQFTYLPLWKTWFKGTVGRFGWLDYEFPIWFFNVALVLAVLILVLAVAELVRRRRAVARRIDELAVYAVVVLGLFTEIGVQSYRAWVSNGDVFEQPRYLLPLLALYAAVIALAVRFGGRRWGPVLAATVVVLAIGHDLYAQAITVARYYA
jgi:4-amino-4-deoxy-L-arabinose transferase-like glycosyltransferase